MENLRKRDRRVSVSLFRALETIWANHMFKPINKLETFNNGRKNIEKIIKKDPNNIEIRLY